VKKVSPMRLSKAAALRLLRDAASDEAKVNIVTSLHEGPWRHVLDYRQIMMCLRDGSLVQHPKIDELGNTAFTLERYSAGVTVRITAILVGAPSAKKSVVVTEFSVDD
jgi:hypothetical protein